MSRTLKTTLLFQLAGCNEREAEVLVTYSITAGCQATYTQPGENDTLEVETLHLIDGVEPVDLTWMLARGYYAEADLAAHCFEDWHDDAIAASEYRAEQRADDLMRARWA